MKHKHYYALVYIIVIILMGAGCSSTYMPPPKAVESKPQDQPRLYEFTLSKAKPDPVAPDEYSRREIESFLCAFAPGFIETSDVYKIQDTTKPVQPEYIVKHENIITTTYGAKHKEIDQKQKEKLENLEINKWFEKRVTYVLKGHTTPKNTGMAKLFFNQLNDIIGREKFVHDERSEIGNIVIEFKSTPPSKDPAAYMGESVRLDDNMRTLFYLVNNQVVVDTYKRRYGKIRSGSQMIRYSPAEKKFRKKNRIIKVYITAVPIPTTKQVVIVHELLHAVGFSGHSPYADSNLFPLPVDVAVQKDSGQGQRIFSQLTRRMLEMLYRPEMLPSMAVKEARDLLMRLKRLDKTSPDSVAAYLRERKNSLEKEKSTILERARTMFERRDEIIQLLNKLEIQKEKLVKELKRENKLDAEIIKDKNSAEIIRLNRESAETQLALLEKQAADPEGKSPEPGKQKQLDKQIAQRKEDLEVWDAIKHDFDINKKRKTQLETEEKNMFTQEEEMNKRLRKIVRRLKTIRSELK